VASSELILAIDIGTTNTKLAIFDCGGKLIWKRQQKTRVINHSGRYEADPESWWTTICSSLSGIDKTLRNRIRVVSTIAQGPTIVLVNNEGVVLGRAVTWMDRRGSQYLEEALSAEPDEQLARVLCKLISLERNTSDQSILLQPADFINLRLTGVTANCSFGTEGFLPWKESTLKKLELDQSFRVPELIESGKVVGKIMRKVADESGLPHDAEVVSGSPDFAAALVGTNTVRSGDLCDRGGTSQGITLCSRRKAEVEGLLTTPFFIDDHWKISGLMNTTGRALEWLQEIIKHRHSLGSELSEKRPTGVIFLPYLNGERSPYWDDNARGLFFGLGLESNAETLLVSVMEGVAHGISQIIGKMENAGCKIDNVRTTGGQALNGLWNQIKADVLGKSVEVPEVKDSELLGAAIYAISHLKKCSIVEASDTLFKTEHVFHPDVEKHRFYQMYQPIFETLYENNKGLFRDLVVTKQSLMNMKLTET